MHDAAAMEILHPRGNISEDAQSVDDLFRVPDVLQSITILHPSANRVYLVAKVHDTIQARDLGMLKLPPDFNLFVESLRDR